MVFLLLEFTWKADDVDHKIRMFIGSFKKRDARIVWVDLLMRELESLNRRLDPSTGKDYAPSVAVGLRNVDYEQYAPSALKAKNLRPAETIRMVERQFAALATNT